ncbi:hypothetical protein [Myroides sp. N17-2]|uniref:hypothetical protein n=1 Tax=Myroides sp. N17-2 TaxID=2030799 RepID=UPI000EFA65DB|nr:hypothetical protein [Myroides sp. N17-2]
MKYIVYVFMALVMVGCKENKSETKDDETKVRKDFLYAIHMSAFDYELYVNDIIVSNNINGNGESAVNSLLPYMFKPGVQKMRIKIKASTSKYGIKKINYNHIADKKIEIGKYDAAVPNEIERIEMIYKLEFDPFEGEVSEIEKEWTFEINDVMKVDNLDNSTDLRLMKEEVLQEEVLSKFEELRYNLDQGKSKKVLESIEKTLNMMMYLEELSSPEQRDFKSNFKKYFDSSKGSLPKLSNYNMKIMGDGRAVVLEYAAGELEGLGILSSVRLNGKKVNSNYIILHKPKSTGVFEVFRYDCRFWSNPNRAN